MSFWKIDLTSLAMPMSGIVEQLSFDLLAAFPESKGFSTTNLWYMKQWYRFIRIHSENSNNLLEKYSLLKNRSKQNSHRLFF